MSDEMNEICYVIKNRSYLYETEAKRYSTVLETPEKWIGNDWKLAVFPITNKEQPVDGSCFTCLNKDFVNITH